MKKLLILSVAALAFTACSNEDLVDGAIGNAGKEGPIGFVMQQGNMTRALTDMQKTGHYNFGVFAYKSTDKVNPIMPNYLVGYYDNEKAYQEAGTTVGDPNGIEDGKSYWMYEGMGSAEYNGTYAGGALTADYKSNNANQYLKYWDLSAENTYFYAYAPYINSTVKPTATYVDGTAQSATGSDTYVLTIPNGSLVDGYDDASLSEYMYASAKVGKANYGHDVALQFKRLNAKVNIKFWEDVPGWKVRILNLSETYNKGVYAAASIKDNTSGQYGYKAGKYYTKNGAKIQFSDGTATGTKQFAGTTATNTTQLTFAAPTDAQIGETRFAASESKTTYYAIPKGATADVLKNDTKDMSQTQTVDPDLAKTGFTFHVTYELTAEDTGERIIVNNASVHVPFEYCNWKENTHYTYIFKITTNSNGTTEGTPTIDPSDPEVPEVASLYPIVFDNCTVEDWDEYESEWDITDGVELAYHNITLKEGTTDMYSFKSNIAHNLTVEVANADKYLTHAVDYTQVTVEGPDAADENTWYTSGTQTIAVPAGAAAGLYTVTYTCPAPAAAHATHPATFTQTFFVGNAYEVNTHRDVIGTNWSDAASEAKLTITTKKDGTAEGTAGASGVLSIVYPENFDAADKALVAVDGTNVVVKKTAKAGTYKLVYKITEGTKQVIVAEKLFEVKDYNLTLSHTTVFNNVGGTVVTGNQTADANHVYTCTTGSVSGNAITVANNTAEGTYTVTYTVYGGAADQTVYTKTFAVKNQYSVSLAKDNIDSMVGTAATGDVSTDGIVVSLKNNGVATDTNLTSALKVVAADAEATATADANFSFVWDGTAKTITLKVKRGAVKKAYKVVYTGQTGYYAVANFVVK